MTTSSRAGLRDVMVTGGAFALGLVLLALFLLVAGFDVPLALGALWRGAFGSWYAITSATLVRATPLILLGRIRPPVLNDQSAHARSHRNTSASSKGSR